MSDHIPIVLILAMVGILANVYIILTPNIVNFIETMIGILADIFNRAIERS